MSEILVNLLLHDLLVHSVVRTVLTTFARIHVASGWTENDGHAGVFEIKIHGSINCGKPSWS